MLGIRLTALLAVLGLPLSCGGGDAEVDGLDRARSFQGHPLYWVGESFEGLELQHVDVGPDAWPSAISAFGYGECEARGDMGCPVPLDIQIRPLCKGLASAAHSRSWANRELRGAPLGTVYGAPVLFTSRVQIKIYALKRGQALRAMQALRSINSEPPVVDPGDPIRPAPRAVLEGTSRCNTS